MTTFSEALERYGDEVRANLAGPGEREALLSRPIGNFLSTLGELNGIVVVPHDEVREQDGAVRPDFGVRVDNVLVGHVELKAPGVSLDPSTYGRSTHNWRQWQRLKELPNLLHTNGLEWRLWRYGEPVYEPVSLHAHSLTAHRGRFTAPSRFENLLTDFLRWQPSDITSVTKLVDTLAPLARMLNEEVKLALTAERRAVRNGADIAEQPFSGIARDWRAMLFPNAKDDEFADGFAQTVVFALVLAISDGIDLSAQTLHQVARGLETHYSLMGRALNLLTDHIENTPTSTAIEMITRTLSAAKWDQITSGRSDVYLHLYEHFLSVYDPVRRKKSGSYYTPVEIVDAMVRLTDDSIKEYLNKPLGLRDPSVGIIDPAMGTGTYPLSVLRHVGAAASNQYGPGAAAEAVSNAAARLYGIELQSGPFSVAELRVSEALRAAGASLPSNGLNLYVADTLEDPTSGSSSELSYTLQLIARQRQAANKVKRERNIQVCIGNPPYKEQSEGLGGWIENGIDPATGRPPLAAFRRQGNGTAEYVLKNLYIYFWRWATWKVFESTDRPDERDGGNGVISFITATGYLTGPGFKGMREYLRRSCSHGWIINVTPEGRTPPTRNAVFNIETPVAIALFLRDEESNQNSPAQIQYLDIHGTKEEKFEELASLSLSDPAWKLARTAWTAPFTPAAAGDWDSYPAVSDLLPWYSPGVKPNRTWVYGPSKEILEERLHSVVSETDIEQKKLKFKESRDATLTKTKTPLPGADTEQHTRQPFAGTIWSTDPKIVRVGFRSFDRQYLVADSRLLHQPSVTLWHGRIPEQVFVIEQHVHHPGDGPGLVFSSLIPDMHHFNNRGGRALPMLHPDGSANLAPGLIPALMEHLGDGIADLDVVYYMAGIAAHPGFVRQFEEELNTPGIRLPITAERHLWDRAVLIGQHVIWLHTYGEAGIQPDGDNAVTAATSGMELPRYETTIGRQMPSGLEYDESSWTLSVGAGTWSNVSPSVRSFQVGGSNVLDSWVGYRRASPRGRRSSPLDDLNVSEWPGEWSIELTELLCVLTRLVALQNDQESLLSDILNAQLINSTQLAFAGVRWPEARGDRNPHLPFTGGLFDSDRGMDS